MATNASDGVAGQRTYTIGVQFTSADVTAGGQNAVLFVQNLTVTGSANGPIQGTGSSGKADVQAVQAGPIATIATTSKPRLSIIVLSSFRQTYLAALGVSR